MKFYELKLKGAYLIELEKYEDERGSFARQFCKKEFQKIGIDFNICQCNLSENKKAGTLRGMHFQKTPFLEKKLVSCFKGKMQDVIIDLRKNSPSYLQYESIILSGEDNKCLYIPENFAHGFQTLEDDTTLYYQLGEFFEPDYYDGLIWDDPAFSIEWIEFENRIISERDNSYPLLNV